MYLNISQFSLQFFITFDRDMFLFLLTCKMFGLAEKVTIFMKMALTNSSRTNN